MNLLLSEKINLISVQKKGLLLLAGAPFIFALLFGEATWASFSLPKEKQQKVDQALISKNRVSALTTMGGVPPKGEISFSSFLEQFNNIAEMFFYDRTQQLFETASTLRTTDLKTATQKMREALALEPDNILILKELSRLELAQANCAGAKELAQKARLIHPFSEELLLIDIQSDVCGNQLNVSVPPKLNGPIKKTNLQEYWIVLEIEIAYKKGLLDRGLELARTGILSKRIGPEIYYWAWKLSTAKKLDGELYAQKYVNNCKALSVRQIRELSIEPNLCKRVVEVENFLKKATVNE